METRFRLGAFATLWVLGSVIAVAQSDFPNLFEARLSIADGLSSDQLYSVAQDENGFIWVATADGLNRYDGQTFRRFYPKPQSENQPDYLFYREIFVDTKGRLWFIPGKSSETRVLRYNSEWETFSRIHDFMFSSTKYSDWKILTMADSGDGTLYFGGHEGVISFDENTHSIKEIWPLPGDPRRGSANTFVNDLEVDRDGGIWIATDANGLAHWNRESGEVVEYLYANIDNENRVFIKPEKLDLAMDGSVWFNMKGEGLLRFDPLNNACRRSFLLEEDGALRTFSAYGARMDLDGTMIVGSADKGLLAWDAEREVFRRYTNIRRRGFDVEYVACSIFKDRIGLYWVATESSGLVRLSKPSVNVSHYEMRKKTGLDAASDNIAKILQARDGSFWALTFLRGIYHFDSEFEIIKHYSLIGSGFGGVAGPSYKAIYEDETGRLFVGSTEGLSYYSEEKDNFERLVLKNEGFWSQGGFSVRSIAGDGTGKLWVGTDAGVLQVTLEGGNAMTVVDLGYGAGRYIHALLFTSDKKLIVGSVDEVAVVDVGMSANGHSRAGRISRDNLSGREVTVMFEDSRKRIWAGTLDGVFRSENSNRVVWERMPLDGLRSPSIQGIGEDAMGRIAVTTSSGVSFFDEDSSRFFVAYEINSEIPATYFSCSLFTSDNVLIIGTNRGLFTSKFLDTRLVAKAPERVSLKRFYRIERDVQYLVQGHGVNFLDLGSENSGFKVDFAFLDFHDPKQNRIAYMLDGYDGEWRYAGKDPSVSYARLPSGSYRLRMRGANALGLWSEETTLSVAIRESLWETIWMRSLIGALLLGLLSWANFRVIRGVRDRNRQLVALVEELNDQIRIREKAESELVASTTRLSLLNNISTDAASGASASAIVSSTLGRLAERFPGFRICYAERDRNGSSFVVEQSRTPDGMRVLDGRGFDVSLVPAIRARLERDQIVFCDDTWLEYSGIDAAIEKVKRLEVRSLLLAPLLEDGALLGFLSVDSFEVHSWSEEERDLIKEVSEWLRLALQLGIGQEEVHALENQLRHAQRLDTIGSMAGGVAHEINNMLQPVLSFTSMALVEALNNSRLSNQLEKVLVGARRIKNLVEKILLFSRRKQADEIFQPIDLSIVVRNAVELLSASAPKSVTITVVDMQAPHIVIGNMGLLEQVLVNIINNAIHAIGNEFGHIKLSIDRFEAARNNVEASVLSGNSFRVLVEDNGGGMDPEVMDLIFDPFFTTKKAGEGTGLGLSVVDGIVRSHGGKIRCQSEVGVGTSFSIYFPVCGVAGIEEFSKAHLQQTPAE